MKLNSCTSIVRSLGALLFLLCCAMPAFAGFVPGSVDVGFTPPGPPPWAGSGGPPPFVFEIVPDNSALANMTITEDMGGLDLELRISGVTTNDPIIAITKDVTNNSGFTWLGYEIAVNGGSNTFVAGVNSSDKFTLASETANLLTFGLPSPVANGETVSFTFQILIPSTGPFQFDLSQQAIAVPEGASIVLLIGSMAIMGVTRRRP
jgi:hypothetical protein